MKYLSLFLFSCTFLLKRAVGDCESTGSGSILPGVIVDVTDDSGETTIDTLCLPLRSMTITGVVVDGIVEVTMTQEFDTYLPLTLGEWPVLNNTQSRYQLPLDEQAAVTAFRAEIGNRIIEGEVKDKDEAKEEFDEAVEDGKPAFLAEQSEPDIFEISCGNLPGNEVVRVTLVYVAPLTVLNATTYQFVLPTKIAPRFDPRVGVTDETLPPLLNDGVEISLGCIMSTSIEVNSGTHDLQTIEITSTVTAIEVIDSDPLSRDIVIDLITQDLSPDPQIFIEQSDEGTSALMLSWVPESDPLSSSDGSDKEWIFILDRSGSMAGTKMAQLRQAMLILLDGLHPDSLYNIVGFGTTHEFLFMEGSERRSNDDAYDTAVSYLNTMSANFGGTYMLGPLEAVLESTPVPTHQRIVLFITDGEASNADELINYVGDNLGSSRVFTLGIGENPARALLNGIARSGDGASDYVNGDNYDDVVEAVQRQIDAATATATFSILSIDWGGVDGMQSPFEPPPIFSGRRYLQYFLANDTSPVGDVNITVQVNNEVTPTSFIIPVSGFFQPNSVFESEVIHSIAARELIRDLEEGRSYLHANGTEPSEEELEAEIVRIGVKYQIVSSETSFIAIDNQGWQSLTGESGPGDGEEAGGGGSVAAPVPAPTFVGLCFSGTASVSVLGKGDVLMRDLAIGDQVHIGNGRYNSVYSFGHRQEDTIAEYLQIHSKGLAVPLELTSDHLIFLSNGRAVPAGTVKIGDSVMMGAGNNVYAKVTKITSVERPGAFAPFTESGRIEVNGLLASSYSSLQGTEYFHIGGVDIVPMQFLAHAFQAPHRLACQLNSEYFCQEESYDDDGISAWVKLPLLGAKWWMSQHVAVQAILGVVILAGGMVCQLVELILMNWWLLSSLLLGVMGVSVRMGRQVPRKEL